MSDLLRSDDKQRSDVNQVTRAAFLRRAALSGTLAGGMLLTGALPATAQDPETPVLPPETDNVSDLQLLNYALTLEHLEATFYVQGLKRFDRDDIRRARQVRRLGRGRVRRSVYDNLILIRDHEVTHVATLISVIKSLGGDPVPPCTYNFDETAFKSPRNFLAVAQVLENTGVMAYDGAIAYIDSQALQTAGATIATVEARHASYLNLVNGDVPFPAAFDTPKAPQEICEAVEAFIVSCPFDLDGFCAGLPNKVIAP